MSSLIYILSKIADLQAHASSSELVGPLLSIGAFSVSATITTTDMGFPFPPFRAEALLGRACMAATGMISLSASSISFHTPLHPKHGHIDTTGRRRWQGVDRNI